MCLFFFFFSKLCLKLGGLREQQGWWLRPREKFKGEFSAVYTRGPGRAIPAPNELLQTGDMTVGIHAI